MENEVKAINNFLERENLSMNDFLNKLNINNKVEGVGGSLLIGGIRKQRIEKEENKLINLIQEKSNRNRRSNKSGWIIEEYLTELSFNIALENQQEQEQQVEEDLILESLNEVENDINCNSGEDDEENEIESINLLQNQQQNNDFDDIMEVSTMLKVDNFLDSTLFESDYIPSGCHNSQKEFSIGTAVNNNKEEEEKEEEEGEKKNIKDLSLNVSSDDRYDSDGDKDCEEIEDGNNNLNLIDIVTDNGEIDQVNGFQFHLPLSTMGVSYLFYFFISFFISFFVSLICSIDRLQPLIPMNFKFVQMLIIF